MKDSEVSYVLTTEHYKVLHEQDTKLLAQVEFQGRMISQLVDSLQREASNTLILADEIGYLKKRIGALEARLGWPGK